MPKYINAEVLQSRLEDFSRWCKDGRKEGVDFVLDCPLPDIPTADVQEIRHGTWRESLSDMFPDGTDYRCSVCGRTAILDSEYCPNCGAKMDRKEAEAKMKGGVEE